MHLKFGQANGNKYEARRLSYDQFSRRRLPRHYTFISVEEYRDKSAFFYLKYRYESKRTPATKDLV